MLISIVFKTFSPKILIESIFGLKFRYICFFHKILQLEKFQGADFKYDNSIFKLLDQKYPNKAFLVKNTQKRHCWSLI